MTPVEAKLKEPDNSNNGTQQKETLESGTTKLEQTLDEEPGGVPMGTQASVQSERVMGIPTPVKDIDLEGLTPAQKEMALKLLTGEADSFDKDDNDVGCIPDLELDLDLRIRHQCRRTT